MNIKLSPILFLIIAMILATLAGFIGFLITVWLPASYVDYRTNVQYPGSGAGATMIAMFLCTPLAFLIAPLAGVFGAVTARYFAGHSPFLLWLLGTIAGALAGFVTAVIFVLIFFILGALMELT